ncbi:ISL3 family transposase [Nakamurella sp. A5-74]|uniref:ISL3 family transposase n=1 Tax=Nakamurella sp. A5-74 TaxID=3158264 RepID=A0AAU8DPR5_9ACTN
MDQSSAAASAADVLFGLEGEFRVLDADHPEPGRVRVLVEAVAVRGCCPGCGTVSSRVKERPLVRLKDLSHGGQVTQWWWRKRRLVCKQSACATVTFTQQVDQVVPRARTTNRLRAATADAVAVGNRAVSEVAGTFGVSWGVVHRALVVKAAGLLPEPEPTRVLGIDETRARSVRWIRDEDGKWLRTNPWMTSLVNADPDGPGTLLGLSPGRSGASVSDWLDLQSAQFKAGVEVVVIDPSAPYAAAVRRELPHARIAVDRFHLVALGNQLVTKVRQRTTRDRHGRRGRLIDPIWNNRRVLLTGADHLSEAQWDRLLATFDVDDPSGQVRTAWIIKERLRMLLDSGRDESLAAQRLWRFQTIAADSGLPEAATLAGTIDTWWPAIRVALAEGVSNGRTEGYNRIIKQTKRVACGFRSMTNYRRRIMVHIAVTRQRQTAA